MSTYNNRGRAPAPQLPERGRQIYEVKQAPGRRASAEAWAERHDAHELRAEEGLATSPDLAAGLLQGSRDAYASVNRYERRVVSGDRSFWGARDPHPAWTMEDTLLAPYANGANGSLSEQKYERRMAPPNGARGRYRNDAAVHN